MHQQDIDGLTVRHGAGMSAGLKRGIRRLGYLLGGAFLILTACFGWAGYLQLTGNVHEVVPGVLYRSAQLEPEHLAEVIEENGIRAVLNLRGAHPKEAWWRDEARVTARLGVEHANLAISAGKIPTEMQLADLSELLASLPRPLLIHCRGGSDRSGLASAIFLADEMGASDDVAERQLSFRYGHVGLPISHAWPMDVTWEMLEEDMAPGLQISWSE